MLQCDMGKVSMGTAFNTSAAAPREFRLLIGKSAFG